VIINFQSLGGGFDQRIGRSADGDDDGIDIQNELAARDLYRTAASLFIRLAEFHFNAPDTRDAAVFGIAAIVGIVVAEHLDRIVQQVEFHTFLNGMLNLLAAGGQLFHRAAINDIDLLRAEPKSRTRSIHRDVSAAADRNPAALADRGDRIVQIGLHQVAAGQEFIGGVNTLQAFSGNVHKARQACAGANKNSLVAGFEQLVDGEHFSDDHVGFHINAERAERIDFLLHNGLGQTEFRNTVNQNTAGGMQRFEYGDGISFFGQIAGAGESGRTGTDHRDPVTIRRGLYGRFGGICIVPVGNKALQAADCNRCAHDAADAPLLALGLLRANAAADCRQGAGSGDDLISAFKITLTDFCDERGNIDIDRATAHAGLVLTVEAAVRLVNGLFL